ncbi:WAP four-disulfide core domain protein 1-like [Glandiceps talaboti]
MELYRVVAFLVCASGIYVVASSETLSRSGSVLSRLLEGRRQPDGLVNRSKRHTHHHREHHKHPHTYKDRGRCPPPPEKTPVDACIQDTCRADSECYPRSCCYNGCLYTCSDVVMPPPVLDWLREPTRQKNSGYWLISGPEQPSTVSTESCSTTVFQDGNMEPGCPTGYVCSIQDDGDPQNDIPNRGVCVKET